VSTRQGTPVSVGSKSCCGSGISTIAIEHHRYRAQHLRKRR
jgi:hypothetical protein